MPNETARRRHFPRILCRTYDANIVCRFFSNFQEEVTEGIVDPHRSASGRSNLRSARSLAAAGNEGSTGGFDATNSSKWAHAFDQVQPLHFIDRVMPPDTLEPLQWPTCSLQSWRSNSINPSQPSAPRRGTRETISRSTALPAITTFSALKEPGKVPISTRKL